MQDIGAELRRRREELGLSLEEVRSMTKIRMDYLEALEEGRPEAIPGDVFVKGFLRAYAGAVGLDGVALVERYKRWREAQDGYSGVHRNGYEQVPERRPADRDAERRRAIRQRRAGEARLGGLVFRVVFLGALGVLFYTLATMPTGEKGRSAPLKPEGPVQPVPVRQTPAAPAPPPPPPPPPVTVQTSVYGRQVTYLVRNVDALRVEADVTAPCWVRVFADGRHAFEATLRPGAGTQKWQAGKELRINAGRPDALRLTVNGVALSPPTDPNPARLIVIAEQASSGPVRQ